MVVDYQQKRNDVVGSTFHEAAITIQLYEK